MRTTVTIDGRSLDQLLRETKVKSKAKAVSIAVDEYLRRRELEKVKELKGKLQFEISADELRHFER